LTVVVCSTLRPVFGFGVVSSSRQLGHVGPEIGGVLLRQ
jgi:hypothetical protein